MVKTTIDSSTPISTTQIVQTKRHQTGLGNDEGAVNYDDKWFSILATARSSFHFIFLEAACIKTGFLKTERDGLRP